MSAGQAAGSKRKSNDAPAQEPDLDDIDTTGMMVDQNCDQVRRKIRRYLDPGAKKGEFCDAIGVSSNSLNSFLGQNGKMKGSLSDSYLGAWSFFKKRDMAGLKMPNPNSKKQKTSDSGTSTTASGSNKEAPAKGRTDMSTIELPCQWDDDVPVYDTCAEVRKKISTHLQKQGVTKAQFCRDLYAQLHSSDAPAKIQPGQLDTFRNKKGPNAGNTSSVYYAAYVYFEKMRLAEGKPKSKHRLEMENVWPQGTDRVHDGSRG